MPTIVQADEDVMGLALESMRGNNVVPGVVTDQSMERVFQWVDADPERIWAGAGIFYPDRVDTADLGPLFEAEQLQVMGEIGAQYRGIAPNDPVLEPIVRSLRKEP
jgi:hypothetical protein